MEAESGLAFMNIENFTYEYLLKEKYLDFTNFQRMV